MPFVQLFFGGLVFVACSALIFWPLEELFEGDKHHRPSFKDLAQMWFFQSYGLWLGAGSVFQLAFLIRQRMPSDLLSTVAALPFWFQVLVALLLAETWVYVFHRLSHKYEFLWRFHRVHHTLEDMTWSAASRHHVVDFLLIIVGANLPAMILGIDLRSIALFLVLERFYTVFLHSNLRWNFGWLSRIVASPGLHRVHHHAGGHRSNYAGILSLLDTVAKTYKPPSHESGKD